MKANKDKGTSVGFSNSGEYFALVGEGWAKTVKEVTDNANKQEWEDMEKEFLKWLDEECPPGTMTYDLSHDFAENLRNRLDELLPDKKYLEIKKKNT